MRVGRGWIMALSLANMALFVGYIGPLQVLLPNQVQDIDSVHKALKLGIVTGIGAAVAMVTGPAAGALSDATGSRFGRRRPWIAGGAMAGAAGLALLSGQHTILGVTIAWCAAQAGLNCMQAGVTALVPDRVPVTQRGAVPGWSGLSQTIGVILAVVLVSDLITGRIPAYLALGVLVMAAAIPILRAPDPQVPREELPVFEARAVLRAFRFSPRRYPDFSWAWATRFLVQLGNSMTILYLLYFLRDKVRYQQLFPGHKAEQGLLILIVIYTLATVTTVVIGGVLSDRSGRRKPAVMFAGYAMAAAAVLLAVWPVWTGAIIAATVLGLGYGVYASVDQALVTQVLPADADRAKDLGIINIANSAPQVLAPALAAPIVTYLGGYPVLFGTVAAATAAGSVFVTKIRSVR
jgi:MFS family permease